MYSQQRSANKNVIFSPQRGSVNENDFVIGSSQQKKRPIFLEKETHSYDAGYGRGSYQNDNRYQQNPREAGSEYMKEVKSLNFKDVDPYQKEHHKSIFMEGPTPQQQTFNNQLFDSRYNGQNNLQGASGQTPYQTSPQRYHRITYGLEGYEPGDFPQQGNPNIFGSQQNVRDASIGELPKKSGNFGSQAKPNTFGSFPGDPRQEQLGMSKSQPHLGPIQNNPTPLSARQGSPGQQGVTFAKVQGSPGTQSLKPNVANPRQTNQLENGTAKKAEMTKAIIAQRPYAILKNIVETPLLPRQETITFEGPERYSVTSDFYTALFKKAEFLLEQLENERDVITNCQVALKAFNAQKTSTIKNLNTLEAEFMQGQGHDESIKSGQQLKKIENLALEIDNCKKLAQDAEKLEDFFKRGIVSRATRKNIVDFDAEVNSVSDRIVKEANALDEHLRLLREFRKESTNSTRFEQKANQVLSDLNWHKDVYLESWNRIHNIFVNLADHFGQQSPELAQIAKKYNDVFNLSDYQAEIRTMELYQQKIAQIKLALNENASFLGGLYQTIDNNSPYIVIRKRDAHEKVIPERKKILENLKREIKTLKYAIKSYRDPSNSKSLASQRIRHKISDSLAEDIKQVNYKVENILLLCDILINIEKEELLFKELYESNLPRCQVKLVEKAEKFHTDAQKGNMEKIANSVDNYCQGFNQLISEYLQIKSRLTNYSGNPEVLSAVGSILRDFIKRVDAQLKVCMALKDKIFKLRYLGSKIETQIDELKIDIFLAEYNQFAQELAKNYTKIETFVQGQDRREKMLSDCRRKNERLKDLASKQSHEKTDDKIKRSAQSLAAIDENLSLLDECTTAAIKIKGTVDYLFKSTLADLEQGNFRSHLKDERDVLQQTTKLVYTLDSKTSKEYETTKAILNWYCPQFSTICQIYDLILKFFYTKEGTSVFNDPNIHRSEINATFKTFSLDVAELSKTLQEEYVKNQYIKCLEQWQRLVDQRISY